MLPNTSYSLTKLGRNTLQYLNGIYEPSFSYNNMYCVSNSLLRKRGYCQSWIWHKFDKIWDEVPYNVSKPSKHKTHLISPITWFFPFSLLGVTFRPTTRHRCIFRSNVNYSRHKISSQNYWKFCDILTQQQRYV